MNNNKENFRDISEKFLNSKEVDSKINMEEFKKFIDTDEEINKYLKSKIENVNFDYTYCFYWLPCRQVLKILPPTDDSQYIRAMYDCINDILKKDKSISALAHWYNRISNKDESVSNFFYSAFRPLIVFIEEGVYKNNI